MLSHIAIFLAELDICGGVRNYISRHLQGIPNLSAIREEKAVLGLGQPSLRGVGCSIVKACVMGTHSIGFISCHSVKKILANVIVGSNHSLALCDFLKVLRNLLGIICGLHQLFLAKENLFDNVGLLLIKVAPLVSYLPAYIIYKHRGHIERAICSCQSVCGFGVHHHNVVNAVVDVVHWYHFLFCSLDYIYIIAQGVHFVKGFLKSFSKIFSRLSTLPRKVLAHSPLEHYYYSTFREICQSSKCTKFCEKNC